MLTTKYTIQKPEKINCLMCKGEKSKKDIYIYYDKQEKKYCARVYLRQFKQRQT